MSSCLTLWFQIWNWLGMRIKLWFIVEPWQNLDSVIGKLVSICSNIWHAIFIMVYCVQYLLSCFSVGLFPHIAQETLVKGRELSTTISAWVQVWRFGLKGERENFLVWKLSYSSRLTNLPCSHYIIQISANVYSSSNLIFNT